MSDQIEVTVATRYAGNLTVNLPLGEALRRHHGLCWRLGFSFQGDNAPPRCFDSAQGPGSSEQARAPEGPGEEEEGPSSQGSEGGPGGPQEEERPGDRAHEETTEAGAGKRGWGEALS